MPPHKPLSLPDRLEDCHEIIGDLSKEIMVLRQQVEMLRRRLFGRSSEKMAAAELEFFGEPLQPSGKDNVINNIETVSNDDDADAGATPAPAKRHGGGGRKPLPAELPRVEIVYALPEERLQQENLKLIRQEVSEQLEFTPSSLVVLRHVQCIYGSRDSLGSVASAPKPPQPIEKSIAGPGLIAHLIVSKYGDHSPLYRQQSILERHGVALSRSTQCDLVLAAAMLLESLSEAIRRQILLSGCIHTDDTPVDVQTPQGRHQARLWVYVGDHRQPYVAFDFTWTRSGKGPRDWLDPFTGILQCDAYGGYDDLFTEKKDGPPPMTEAGCLAHARRYFFDAKGTEPVIALDVLRRIRKLYDVEKQCKHQWPQLREGAPDPEQFELAAAARHQARQQQSRPLWIELKARLDELEQSVLPKSPLGKAVGYALNHWTALGRFLEDGRVEIDNNAAERALRPLCLGRKNWLHLGSRRGGRAAATLLTLIVSARRHGIDPFLYLRDLLERVSSHPHSRIHELLPDQWKLLFQDQARAKVHALRESVGQALAQAIESPSASQE